METNGFLLFHTLAELSAVVVSAWTSWPPRTPWRTPT